MRNLSPEAKAHQAEQQKEWHKENTIKLYTAVRKQTAAEFDEIIKPNSRHKVLKMLVEKVISGEINIKEVL